MKTLAIVSFLAVFLAHNAMAQQDMSIPTYSPSDYTEILNGAYKQKPARIAGKLYMPDNVSKPVPSVVIMHGSGGVEDYNATIAESLQQNGIAALVLDSFSGRGLSSTGQDQGKLSMAASVLDAFQALLALRQQPGIDGSRVGIVGFSRGGVAALFSNQEPIRRAVLGEALGFRGHVPVFPGCSTQWEHVQPTKMPVLFLLGQKDDLTPADKCQTYADRIVRAGGNAQVVIYPDGYHNFMKTRYNKNTSSQNYGSCDMTINDQGNMLYPRIGIGVNGDWASFVNKVFADCGTKGYSSGGSADIRDQAIRDITNFFQRSLR